MAVRGIELLAPARDYVAARAAVDYGADAVYMGAPKFGARYAAGNSVEDIARAVEYAARYGVRVYAALNTVLFDGELEQAQRQAEEVIAAGVDALIIQDMAYMEMGLRSVEFHASTQVFNASPQKVKFLQDAGFSRVILERNLTYRQIEEIREATDVELEVFVHGAICVCHSGRCYMSRTMGPRSGNRGECSQPCRLTYDLLDADMKPLIKEKHLLSVQDLDLSGRIGELLDAGITSFKIEGRLKDENYVKNTVAGYRRCLDRELSRRSGLTRASAGSPVYDFDPDLWKTFTRGRSEYFFDGPRRGVASFDTPKALGEYAGRVSASGRGWIELFDEKKELFDEKDRNDEFRRHNSNLAVSKQHPKGIGRPVKEESGGLHLNNVVRLSNGDGICFMAGALLEGANVNRVDGKRIFLSRESAVVERGTEVFRNYDHRFSTMLSGSRTRRVIDADALLEIGSGSITLLFTDEDGVTGSASLTADFDAAQDPAKTGENLRMQIRKSGGTIFRIGNVAIVFSAGDKSENSITGSSGTGDIVANENRNGNMATKRIGCSTDNIGRLPFIPAATINGLRREALDRLLENRLGRREASGKSLDEKRLLPRTDPDTGGDNSVYSAAANGADLSPAAGNCGVACYTAVIDHSENVTNALAERFYRRHGATEITPGLDTLHDFHGKTVMRTPYCIRRETGRCLKNAATATARPATAIPAAKNIKTENIRFQGNFTAGDTAGGIACDIAGGKTGDVGAGDLFLRRGTHLYRLKFDCRECIMEVIFV